MHFTSSDFALLLVHHLKAGLVFDSDLNGKKKHLEGRAAEICCFPPTFPVQPLRFMHFRNLHHCFFIFVEILA